MQSQDKENNNVKTNLEYDDILNIKNIESIKLLAVLIINDSIQSDNIASFYKDLGNIIYDQDLTLSQKLSSLAILIDQQKNYIDSAFEIWLNSLYTILIDKKNDEDVKYQLIKFFFDNFDFFKDSKNQVGRLYLKEERIIKTISRLFQIIAEYENQNNEISELKYLIFCKFKEFLQYHLYRANKFFNNFILFDQTSIQYNLNLESLKNNEEELKKIIGINSLELQKKINNILNTDKIIFKYRCETLIIIAFLLDYEDAIPAVLGMIDYFSFEDFKISYSNNIIEKKKFYYDLFKKDLKSIKSTSDLASSIKKMTKQFSNNAETEIKNSIEHLETSAKLLKSNNN